MVPLLAVRDLKVWFPIRSGVFSRTRGWKRAVDGVCFELYEGETLGIIGESGCGKTTLSRALLGLVEPTGGRIESVLAPNELQVVFQAPLASLNPRHTIRELVSEAAIFHGLVPARGAEDWAVGLLEDVGLDAGILERYPHELSGGQCQRVGIARALALNPRVVICDEAVSALDLSVRAQILNLLEDLKRKRGFSCLFITHDIGVVEHLADRLLVMREGRVVESGTVEEVLTNPKSDYTRELIEAVPRLPAC